MILWLSSYPKSGNTWVRAILSSLLYTDDGNFSIQHLKKIDIEKKFLKEMKELKYI